MKNLTSKQLNPPNPTGKGGFQDHPELRSNGRWSKENSFTYWMNYFKHLTVKEFLDYEKTKPDDERTVAESLAYVRVMKARKELVEFREVANRTEGMPIQSTDITSGGQRLNTIYDLITKATDQDTSQVSE